MSLSLVLGASGSDRSVGIDDDSLPWEVLLVGGLTLALVALIALAMRRQRRKSQEELVRQFVGDE